jgi:hypothetical protein
MDSLLRQFGRTEFSVLAVILDDHLAETHASAESSQLWHGRVDVGWGNSMKTVDHFCIAPIVPLGDNDWMVKAASTMNEVQEMSTRHSEPSNIALWSLLCDYDVGEEKPSPRSRPPVRWFPLLRLLTNWDADWLVSLIVGRVRAKFDCQDNQILLVLPDEDNASRPLADAVKRGAGGAVATITREVLDGTAELDSETKDLISAYHLLRIVAVDESSVTGSTLTRISELVETERGRACDLRITIFRAVKDPREDIEALFSWRPYLEVSRV